MSNRKQRRSLGQRAGKSPGALVIAAGALPTRIRLLRFDAHALDVRDDLRVDQLAAEISKPGLCWIDVVGFGSERPLEELRELLAIPWLALADIVNVPQRPRLEVHSEGTLAILSVPRPGAEIDLDQLSFWAQGQVVVSFREHPDAWFDPPLARLRDPKSRLRSNGPDYLLYRLVDSAIDAYFPHLDRLSDRMDSIESQVVSHPSPRSLSELYLIRREFGLLLRAALPTRDVLSSLSREGCAFVRRETVPFMNDVHDHVAQVIELSEHHRDAASEIQELIVGTLDLRMNQVMKVLTAVTVVFIPLSFVTGIFGMNFKFMPELGWTYAYPVVLVALMTIGLWIYRRLARSGWFKLEEE